MSARIPVFSFDVQFPHAGQHGFSVYQGVLVVWDDDYDQRILAWIDSLKPDIRMRLYAANEHEGSLSLMWRGSHVPRSFREDMMVRSVADQDSWIVIQSVAIDAHCVAMCGRLLPVADMVTDFRLFS